MGTRAVIAKLKPNGRVSFCVTNSDGYTSYTGAFLVKHYRDEKALDALLALKAFDVLEPVPEQCEVYTGYSDTHRYDDAELDDFLGDGDFAFGGYHYLWDNGTWFLFGRTCKYYAEDENNPPAAIELTRKFFEKNDGLFWLDRTPEDEIREWFERLQKEHDGDPRFIFKEKNGVFTIKARVPA